MCDKGDKKYRENLLKYKNKFKKMDADRLKQLCRNLEAVLFWKSEPVSVKEMSKVLEIASDQLGEVLDFFENKLHQRDLARGIVLIRNGDEISLATSPESSALIEKLTLDEHSVDLGRASLETLAIILYKGPIRRSEIDRIRGVNSSFILRNLLIRGLIAKTPDPKDSRTSLYSSSFELLGHLGITEISKLPDYERVQEEIRKFTEHQEQLEQSNSAPAETKSELKIEQVGQVEKTEEDNKPQQ